MMPKTSHLIFSPCNFEEKKQGLLMWTLLKIWTIQTRGGPWSLFEYFLITMTTTILEDQRSESHERNSSWMASFWNISLVYIWVLCVCVVSIPQRHPLMPLFCFWVLPLWILCIYYEWFIHTGGKHVVSKLFGTKNSIWKILNLHIV